MSETDEHGLGRLGLLNGKAGARTSAEHFLAGYFQLLPGPHTERAYWDGSSTGASRNGLLGRPQRVTMAQIQDFRMNPTCFQLGLHDVMRWFSSPASASCRPWRTG